MSIFSNMLDNFAFSRMKKKSLNLNELLGYSTLNSFDWHDVKATLAWYYWAKVHTIWRSTNLISQELASIKPIIINNKTKEIYREYDSRIPATYPLKLLIEPNSDTTHIEFITSNIESLLVTGETYIITGGLKEPVQMFWQNPNEINIISDNFYMPKQIIVNNPTDTIIFTRNDNDYRYYTSDGLRQIYQIIDFNPFYKYGNQRGFSRLSPLFFSIEEYIKGNLHNINMMRKGARPSGVLTVDDTITNDQLLSIKDQVNKFYSGVENSGNLMVLNNGREFKTIDISNRDMEYSELNKIAKQNVYEVFEIPSSFFDNATSTYNNKLNDRINLYIFAIIPLALRLYGELTKLFYYDKNKYRDYEISFLIKEIPALEAMFDDSNLRKSQSGVFTINELRERYSLEDIGTEGDIVYQPMNLLPVGNSTKEIKKYDIEMIEKKLLNKNISKDEIGKIINVINKSNA